jgi:hypothetical protein
MVALRQSGRMEMTDAGHFFDEWPPLVAR